MLGKVSEDLNWFYRRTQLAIKQDIKKDNMMRSNGSGTCKNGALQPPKIMESTESAKS